VKYVEDHTAEGDQDDDDVENVPERLEVRQTNLLDLPTTHKFNNPVKCYVKMWTALLYATSTYEITDLRLHPIHTIDHTR